MRGDSLRDFYAKTLAVLGLGLIAGAGAIVDYWPTGIRLPDAASPSIARITVQPLTQNFNQQVPAPAAPVARPVVHQVSARNVRWPAFTPKPSAVVAVSPAAPEPVAAAPVIEPRPTEPVALVSYATPMNDWASEVVLASRLTAETLEDSLVAPAAPTGFIGGALKKTKESLVKTGVVTGGSIADAFRGVMGAFKKVSPF